MKKQFRRINMKTNRMATRAALAVVLACVSWGSAAHAQAPSITKLLTSRIDYTLVPGPRPMDDEGRNLVWEATVQGDINGTMKWWFEAPPPAGLPPFPGGSVAYYAGRWEIWDESGEELLLAGLSAGKTVFPAAFPAEAGMWDGHGVVTEAREEFSPLKGRRISETGPVIFPEVPGPLYGTGIFVIY